MRKCDVLRNPGHLNARFGGGVEQSLFGFFEL